MAKEASGWIKIREALKALDPKLHTIRIENGLLYGAGTPDVNLCLKRVDAWVENKALTHWPDVPADRVIKLDPEFNDQQRLWHRARWAAGGNCWLILAVLRERDWLLFSGDTAAEFVGISTRQVLIREASFYYQGGPFPAKLFWEHIRTRALRAREL